MTDKINPIRDTDDQAIELAKKLVSETRYVALAVRETGTSVPLVSRVAGAWSEVTGFFFCASDLSVHSQCLKQDGTCSLLNGEPGKGDGLAHPRITLIGSTTRMANDDPRRGVFRNVFLQTHPKSELYIDFADFGFYPVKIERAQLNGGFGKAYHLRADDLAFIGG